MSHCAGIVETCMSKGLNVLLVGDHGVGKTAMVVDEAKRQGLTLKYYSSPTLDPWADLVGIPVPAPDERSPGDAKRHLTFLRPADVERAEILFFDELNRAHPKVLNAVLEAIQFRTINGVALPKLKMVWAAINPPGGVYQVAELDPVLVDRFHVHLEVPADPSVDYYIHQAGIPPHIAKALVMWWHRDLDDNLRTMISPRRLEYMGKNYQDGIELRYSLPSTIRAPLQHLLRRIDGQNLLPFELTRKTIIDHQEEIVAEMAESADVMLAVSGRLLEWPDLMPQCIPLFLAMTSELQARLLANHTIKTALVNLAREGRKGNQDLRPLADRLVAMGMAFT